MQRGPIQMRSRRGRTGQPRKQDQEEAKPPTQEEEHLHQINIIETHLVNLTPQHLMIKQSHLMNQRPFLQRFIVLQFLDWHDKPFTLATSTYSSIYFTIGGFHLAHVVAGLLIFAVLLIWTALGYFDAVRHVPITVGTLYWYFLAAVWLAVFFVLYITPYLA